MTTPILTQPPTIALHVYAVDWDALAAALGCGDEQLMRALDAELDDDLGMTDLGPSEDLALAHLIAGRPAQGEPRRWIYALERLCKRFGHAFDTADWQQTRWRDVEAADWALQACKIHGQPLRDLFDGQLPVSLPTPPQDGELGAQPTIGALDPARVAQLLPRVTRGWLDLDPKGDPMRLIVSLERWLEQAHDQGYALVGVADR